MKATDVVSEIELEMEESQNERDARVEALWKRLDYQRKGELDWKALQRGLKKIDHRQSHVLAAPATYTVAICD
jgi:solute carrier family 25 phosphate transporter 23/24/25/41